MGFVNGLTGGVALTLSIAYLSVLAHQRNREEQGRSLRAQALTIQSLIDPIPQPLPPTRSEVAAAKRAETVEVLKERWNTEIESAVRWVQHADWEDVREGLEDRIASLWDAAFGESIQETATKGKTELQKELQKGINMAQAGAVSAADTIKAQAKSVFEKAKAEEEDFAAKVKDNALQARLAAWRAAQKAEKDVHSVAVDAQEAVKSALEKGKEMATEAAGKVGSAVGLTGEGTALGHVSVAALNPVQKALDQRFERPSSDMRSVAEVLKQRYTAMDRRDNTVLRGL
ncbi:hypothetical protein E4U19_000852 [Claviceps sp. Clav32 group G5]|nr:hypothetical protein E4U40_001296 [Claviceps sp. LM458 group G5]KAG6038284.1 hypothetical protein E4U19_000852 [Claviceps sp. Clav32 group G5]KAG6044640.1 hypothetical protein E4U39_003164 [Claviceps sp. Clav50 group G5]